MYDWKPTLCGYCKKYGHADDICRKKNPPKPVQKEQEKTQNTNEEHEQMGKQNSPCVEIPVHSYRRMKELRNRRHKQQVHQDGLLQ